jgi:hypothetical protein
MRTFDVKVGERDGLYDVDPFRDAGGFAIPLIREIEHVQVRDGKLRIEFIPRTMNPVVNGIEILREPDARRGAKRILFIGNSLHLFWALPETVEAMVNAERSDLRIETHRSLYGGKDLKFHYEETDAVSRIRAGQFDYVALQEGLTDPIRDRAQMFEYAEKFNKVIRESGGRTLLFIRWAFRYDQPERQDQIIEADAELAAKLHIVLVPIGAAWQEALRQRPELTLHNPDGLHPGLHGAYLNACVYYAVLAGRSPEGNRNPTVLGQGVKVESDAARFLERIAWETAQKYRPLTLLR